MMRDIPLSFIRNLMSPTNITKVKNGEVFTPFSVIKEKMEALDKHTDVLSNADPYKKWLDPAGGIGNYPLYLYHLLMTNLKDYKDAEIDLTNEENRKKHILEKMIYYAELTTLNVSIYKKLIDPLNNYKLNIYQGSSIEYNAETKKYILEEYFDTKFDFVIGNPPFNGGLWKSFMDLSHNILNKNSYVLFIHPGTWRFPPINKDMFKYDILQLNIYDDGASKKLFKGGAEIQVDYYIFRNTITPGLKTQIISNINREKITNEITFIDIKKLPFCPNYGYEIFSKYFKNYVSDDNLFAYMNKTKIKSLGTDETQIIHNIRQNNEIVFGYTNETSEKTLKNIKKVLISVGRNVYAIYDEGQYGISDNIFYIQVEDELKANNIITLITSTDFVKMIRYSKGSSPFTPNFIFKLMKNVM